jgi:NAD(P)-dependent dehydrogenase (short-subunit alcohol dehydrogenase family)
MTRTGELSERVAIVTGAGRGIGYAIALAFAEAGARVIIGELVRDRGLAAAERLRYLGHRAEAYELDVRSAKSCQDLVSRVVSDHGRVDSLVNNAGVAVYARAEDMAETDWRLQIDVMLTGTFLVTQAVGRIMIANGGGSIVNIASVGGMGGWPLRSAYNAAKAGVINLTEGLATEWAQYNIRVNCVSPGSTRTEMAEEAVRAGVAQLETYANRTPMGRLAEVHEIAAAVLFLASDRSSFVTGVNLRVDGGWVPWGNPSGQGFPVRGGADD